MPIEPSPLQRIDLPLVRSMEIELYVKRDDLLHPVIQGNKWRKLGLVLQKVKREGYCGVLSRGGPFSNHLHALAAAGCYMGIQTIGIVRSWKIDSNNPTIKDLIRWGMQLIPLGKTRFDSGWSSAPMQEIVHMFPNYYLLQDGGSGEAGELGCYDIIQEIRQQLPYDSGLHILLGSGTGTTALGIARGLNAGDTQWVFPVDSRMPPPVGLIRPSMHWVTEFSTRGFGKPTGEEMNFVHTFHDQTGILVDPIYNLKVFRGCLELAKRGVFEPGSRIVVLHTGGIQGWQGMMYLYPEIQPPA